jgi:hypothetical protein
MKDCNEGSGRQVFECRATLRKLEVWTFLNFANVVNPGGWELRIR